jgi:raffinose/stachyose/melibiose transport system permease protein
VIHARSIPIPGRRGRVWRERQATAYLLLAPGLLLHLCVVGIPVFLTVCLSLTTWDGIGPITFAGLDNFRRLVGDRVFWQSFANNLRWIAVFLTVPMAMGLVVAALLGHVERGRTVYRALIFLPYVLSAVVVSRIWGSLYHPFYGLNALTGSLGWGWARLSGIGDPAAALYYVANAANWHWWPFPAVVFLAAMQQIDRSLYEAAAVEGASDGQAFRYVTLPLLRPTVVFLLLMATIWGFNAFDYVYVMTKGGPAHASELMATWIFSTMIEQRDAGYAATLAVALGTICSTVIALYVHLRRRGWEV